MQKIALAPSRLSPVCPLSARQQAQVDAAIAGLPASDIESVLNAGNNAGGLTITNLGGLTFNGGEISGVGTANVDYLNVASGGAINNDGTTTHFGGPASFPRFVSDGGIIQSDGNGTLAFASFGDTLATINGQTGAASFTAIDTGDISVENSITDAFGNFVLSQIGLEFAGIRQIRWDVADLGSTVSVSLGQESTGLLAVGDSSGGYGSIKANDGLFAALNVSGGATVGSDLSVGGVVSGESLTVGNNGGAGSSAKLYLASGDASHAIYSTGSGGNTMVFVEYGANYQFTDSRNDDLTFLISGRLVETANNTLDDSSGNASFLGSLNVSGGATVGGPIAGASLNVSGNSDLHNTNLHSSPLWLTVGDGNHRLQYDAAVNGPILHGYAGVQLATTLGDVFNLSGGVAAFNGSLNVSAGSSTGKANIGPALIGSWPSLGQYAFFGNSHLDQTVNGNYSLIQSDQGQTFINSSAGKSLSLRIGNGDAVVIDADKNAVFGGNVTVDGALFPTHVVATAGTQQLQLSTNQTAGGYGVRVFNDSLTVDLGATFGGPVTASGSLSVTGNNGEYRLLQNDGVTGFRWRLNGDGSMQLERSPDNFTVSSTVPIYVGTDSSVSFPQSVSIGNGNPGDSLSLVARYAANHQVQLVNNGGDFLIYSIATNSNLMAIDGSGASTFYAPITIGTGDQQTSRLSIVNGASGGSRWDLVAGVNNTTQSGFSIYNAAAGTTSLIIDAAGDTLLTGSLVVGSGAIVLHNDGSAALAGPISATNGFFSNTVTAIEIGITVPVGSEADLHWRDSSSVSPANVSFSWSRRPDGDEFWMYGYDGSGYSNLIKASHSNQLVSFTGSGGIDSLGYSANGTPGITGVHSLLTTTSFTTVGGIVTNVT